MVDTNQIVKNVVPAILVILVAAVGVWLVVSVGLPFLDDPDTFEPTEVVSIEDTENKIIMNLTEPSRASEIDVLVGGAERQFDQNNTITVNKSGSPEVVLESYPENEGLFGTYEYPMGEEEFNLNYSDEIVEGESNVYTLESTVSDPDRIEWFIKDELQRANIMEFEYEFESTGEQNITYRVETSNVTYRRSESIDVLEPGEVVLDVNITSTELVSFESFDMNITEETSKGIENLDIEWGDGENTTVSINESVRYWYRSPGQYNLTISGQSTVSDASVTENISMNVSEREDDEDISRLNINVFDREGDPIPNSTVSVGSVTQETDESGFVRVKVRRGEYEIRMDKAGYVPDNRTVLIADSDVVIDESLTRVTPERPEVNDNGTGVDIGNPLPEAPNSTNSTQIPLNTDFDSITLSTFERLNGTGTSEDPYKITNYTQLQSIRVQPTANYRLTQNIDASLSFQQDLIEEVENRTVATADDRSIYLPHINSKPDELTIQIGDRDIASNEYEVVVEEGSQGRPQNQRVFVAFNMDGNVVSAEEKLDVESGAPVLASYDLPESQARGFRPIDANNAVINIDGNGYKIENMYINRPLEDDVGLVRNMNGGSLSNIRMIGQVVGGDQTGGFVGSATSVTLSSLNVSGVVSGRDQVGGVAGQLTGSQVNQAYTTSGVFGYEEVGGVVGSATDGGSPTKITESFVGTTFITPILGLEQVGGVAGSVTDSRIQNTYTTGYVIGLKNETGGIGGIAGRLQGDSEVSSVYATSRVVGSDSVDSVADAGGIIGRNDGSSVEAAYWNTELSADAETSVGTNDGSLTGVSGLSTSEMTTDTVNSMSEFDFDDVWTNRDGNGGYPQLQSEFEEFELTVSLQKNGGDVVESPIVTVINSDGEQVATESLENSEVIETSFTLVEGGYTIQAGSAEYSTETDVNLADDRTVSVILGGN